MFHTIAGFDRIGEENAFAVLARATDDAWLIERQGDRVIVVAADGENLKVTTPVDLQLAELLLGRRSQRPVGRWGL